MAAKRTDTQAEQAGAELSRHIRDVIEGEIRQHGHKRPESTMADLDVHKVSILDRDIFWRIRPVGLRYLSSFTHELSILLNAGMPLLTALRNIGRRTRHQKLQQVIYRVGVMVENGHAFWEALGEFPRVFSPLFVSTVKSGELSGRLGDTLEKISTHLEKENMLHRKLGGAMVYPVLVIAVAITVVLALTKFIMPTFIDMIEDFDTDMPWITEAVMEFARWLPEFWYLFLIVPLILFVFYQVLKSTYPGRLLIDRIKISIPVFGGIMRKVTAARFSRTFTILDDSGVPILESLSIVRDTVGNEVVALDVEKLRNGIESGQSLEEATSDTNSFPPLLLDMLVVGEQSGRLDSILPKIADVYEGEVDIVMANIGTIIEPVLIVTMGVFVAIVLTAFFLPYITLLNAALQV